MDLLILETLIDVYVCVYYDILNACWSTLVTVSNIIYHSHGKRQFSMGI